MNGRKSRAPSAIVAASARAKLDCGAALTVTEAAALLGVSPKTIERWRYQQRKGQAAPLEFRRFGGCLRVMAESVRALMQPPAGVE